MFSFFTIKRNFAQHSSVNSPFSDVYAMHSTAQQRTHPQCGFIRGRSGKLSDYSPLFGTHGDISGAQCPDWDFSVKERTWKMRRIPVQGHQDSCKLQHRMQKERLRELVLFNLQ